MTREEAIKLLKEYAPRVKPFYEPQRTEYSQAIDMAIEALTEPKTIIGIDIPYGNDKGLAAIFKGKDEKLILEEVKEIISVVRCKDCKWRKINRKSGTLNCGHEYGMITAKDDNFCNYGERREE